ncbi:MAG TPA: hypothetical protein VHK67_07135 [Rhabdochlamydiaceae bacterium]|jgi:hypothetical protein|nr:hypothetical protein [Rhabdochlamydiaceae bacterium]
MEKNDGHDLIPSKLTFEDLKKVNQYGIAKIGGTPPENIPPAEHIKHVRHMIMNKITLKR